MATLQPDSSMKINLDGSTPAIIATNAARRSWTCGRFCSDGRKRFFPGETRVEQRSLHRGAAQIRPKRFSHSSRSSCTVRSGFSATRRLSTPYSSRAMCAGKPPPGGSGAISPFSRCSRSQRDTLARVRCRTIRQSPDMCPCLRGVHQPRVGEDPSKSEPAFPFLDHAHALASDFRCSQRESPPRCG